MDHYPDYLMKHIWMHGARLFMRPATVADASLVADFCRRVDEDANPFRLPLPAGDISAAAAVDLARLDEFEGMTILVEHADSSNAVVALGRYQVAPGGQNGAGRVGELATLIAQAWRTQPFESALLHQILTAAIEVRLDGLFGIAVRRLPEMQTTLAECSELVRLKSSQGMIRADFDFTAI